MTALIALLSLTMGGATDALTAHEQLYLDMLIKQRDAWARNLQHNIVCEN